MHGQRVCHDWNLRATPIRNLYSLVDDFEDEIVKVVAKGSLVSKSRCAILDDFIFPHGLIHLATSRQKLARFSAFIQFPNDLTLRTHHSTHTTYT